jgi:hypothetical protein
MQSPVVQHRIVAMYCMHPLRIIHCSGFFPSKEIESVNNVSMNIPVYTFHELNKHVQSVARLTPLKEGINKRKE